MESVSVSDSSPEAGASFTLSATVRNRGDGRSGSPTPLGTCQRIDPVRDPSRRFLELVRGSVEVLAFNGVLELNSPWHGVLEDGR